MSLYDAALTARERNALKKHTSSLQDEINLLRTLINRSLTDDLLDIDTLCKAIDSLTKAELAKHRLQTKPDDELKLAFSQALNSLDAEETDEPT